MINNYTKATIKMISSMIIFGTIGIFVRNIDFSSGIIALARAVIGTVFLILYVLITKKKISFLVIKKNFRILCFSGMFLGINWILLFEAYKYTSVATATLCYYMAPIFVILISPFLFKEKLTGLKGTCVFFAFVGMILVSGGFDSGFSGNNNFAGVLFGLSAAVFYASVIILNKKLKDISPYEQTIVQLIISIIVIIPYIVMKEDFTEIPYSGKSVFLLVIIGILHTGISYSLYFSSMIELKAQRIAFLSYIDPITAILISAFILKESMSLLSLAGGLLILFSYYMKFLEPSGDS